MLAPLCIALALAAPLPAGTADQYYYWRWSDSSTEASRVFTQARYGIPSNLPTLVITAEPATPGQVVSLQFLRDGRWTTEASARTSAAGIATISIDPTCGSSWCERTFAYRLKAGGQTARLSITYSVR